MGQRDWKDKSDAATSWIGIAIVIIGGIFGLFEYSDKKDQWRTEKSLAMVERLRKGSADTTIVTLEKIWIANRDQIFQTMQKNAKSQNPDKTLYSKMIIGLVESKDLQLKIFETVKNYEEVAVCARHRVCSISVTLDMLGKEMSSFYNRWLPFIAHHCRKIYNSRYAVNLAQFVALFNRLERSEKLARPNVPADRMREITIKQWLNADRTGAVNPDCKR